MNDDKAPDSIVSYDLDSMELEWTRQGGRVKEYGEMLGDAKYNENVLEGKLKLVEAQLSTVIRNHPDAYGMKTASDERVKQAAIMQSEYQKVLRRLNKAKRVVDYCKAALAGLKEKSTGMVETLKGQLAGFFGEPRDPTGRAVSSRPEIRIKKGKGK